MEAKEFLSRALVSSILDGGKEALRKVQERGIVPAYLEGDAARVLEFVYDYAKQHGGVPTRAVTYAKTEVALDTHAEPITFWIDELFNVRLFDFLKPGLEDVLTFQKSRKPREALDLMQKLVKDAVRAGTVPATRQSLHTIGMQVVDHYDLIKSGKRGVLTPWPSVNEETLGLWPQDLFLLAARLGKGKTWLSLLMAEHAWVNKHKVLYATTEMSRMKICQRLLAVHFKLPYGDFRRGTLPDLLEKKFKEGVESLMSDDLFQIVGGDFDYRIEKFRSEVEDIAPELVVLDGAYLLRVEGRSKTEQAANAFDEIKRLAHVTKTPFVVTTQFNREVKGNQQNSARVESIAQTDAAGWNADNIYALEQTDDMKKAGNASLKPLKSREGAGIKEVLIRWNFDNMDFSEIIGATTGSGGGGGGPSGDSDPFEDSPTTPADYQLGTEDNKPDTDEGLPF